MSTDVMETIPEDENQPLFANLNPDDPEQGVMVVESMCPNCEEQGVTRLMLTRIPYFQELILSSFQCDHCGHNNRSVQYGGRIQDKGVKYEVKIKTNKDLNRQVIKSDTGTFSLPHLDFQQESSEKGEITTVEGLINSVIRGLSKEQPIRKSLDPDLADKIQQFIGKMEKLKTLSESFNIVIDDPSGNSYVENPSAPEKDQSAVITHYTRTKEHNVLLGLQIEGDDILVEQPDNGGSDSLISNSQPLVAAAAPVQTEDILKDEVLSFPTNCPACTAPCETKMKLVDIPFFKEVVIMATSCDACGNRENEVKGGSGIEEKGTKITLKVTDPSDLNRDILKSDTCGVEIPEIGLELVEGTLGGRFTTVEGILVQVKDELQSNNPFFMGDSAGTDTKTKMNAFFKKLDAVISGEMANFTFILNDPAGNSYLQNLYAPEPDPEMTIEHYTRTDEQNDELGLLDMKTENYTEDTAS